MTNSKATQLLRSVRATRHFSDADVTDDLLLQIVDAARWTGSARNRQPWKVAIVRTPALRRALGDLGDYAHHLATAPCVIALATDAEIGGSDTEFDAGRLCQSIVIAAAALGLGTCPATLYPEPNAARAADVLGYDQPWRVHHAVSIGWPQDVAAPGDGRPAVPTGRQPLTRLLTIK